MISKAYKRPDFQILTFALDDVITVSNVIHTTTAPSTTAPTTLPGTTSGGIEIGKPGEGGAEFDYSDFFG